LCTEGVNHAQLKISLTQAMQLAGLCHKNISQWKEVLQHLNSQSLAEHLGAAEGHFAQSLSSLRKTLEEAERLASHHHDDSVTITKL